MIWMIAVAAGATLEVCEIGCDFDTIQAAIDAAAVDDTVHLEPGLYEEAVVIDKDLRIEGTFDRVSWVGPDGVDAVITVEGCNVTFDALTLSSSHSRGLVIEDGQVSLERMAFDVDFAADKGSAVLVGEGSTLTVSDSHFVGGSAVRGAHLFLDFGTTTIIRESVFDGGFASGAGGAIASAFSLLTLGDLILLDIEDSVFRDNSAAGQGGAIAFWGGIEVSLNGVVFQGNHAANGGAVSNGAISGGLTTGTITVEDSVFQDNTASEYGGALRLTESKVTVLRSVFEGNMAAEGGAIRGVSLGLSLGFSLAADLRANRFCQNTALERGGAVYLATYALQSRNNLWVENRAPVAAGLDLRNVGGTIQNDTFVGGTADESSAVAVLGLSSEDPFSLTNSIVAFNGPGRAVVGAPEDIASLSLSHNLWFGNPANISGDVLSADAVSADPEFFGYQPGQACDLQQLWTWAGAPGRGAGVDGEDIGAYGALSVEDDLDGVLTDDDEDGSLKAYDCDWTDPEIHEGVAETYYNGVDENCDQRSDYDADHDDYDSAEYGGEDCNDDQNDPAAWGINPGVDEYAEFDWSNDGIDQDCDGADVVDFDGDGYPASEDCNDQNPRIHPGAEDPDLGTDWNCDDFDHGELGFGWPGCAAVDGRGVAWLGLVVLALIRRERG